MRYNGKNLNEVLEAHKKWRNGKGGEQADLRGADLIGADLSGAHLGGADLSRAYLIGADLSGADLIRAYLSGANLRGAKLMRAALIGADLSGADLRGAHLMGVDLSGAYLMGADLSGAHLGGADISGTHLSGARNIPFIPMACPDSGSFIGWKKCRVHGKNDQLIVKLLIPEDARRSSATGRKCRCNKAVVLEIQNLDGSKSEFDTAVSTWNSAQNFAYKIGETVVPENGFCEDRFTECAEGIHFFINRQEAVEY